MVVIRPGWFDNGRTTVRPYKGLHVLLYYNGRHPTRHYPCVPTTGYTSCCTATDAQTVRPYNGLHVSLYCNGRTDRASLQESSPCVFTGVVSVRPYHRYTLGAETPSWSWTGACSTLSSS